MASGNTITSVIFYLMYMTTVMFSYRFKWRRWNWYAIISFAFILGLRGNGIDYFAYRNQYLHLLTLDYNLFDPKFYAAEFNWSTQNFEWYYLVIIKILKNTYSASLAFFFIIALTQIVLLDLFVQHFMQKKLKSLLIFFFFTTLMFVESFNVMRQLIAILAFINIIPYLVERDYKKYFLFCGCLYLVHSSALILAPLYFFNKDVFKKEYLQFVMYFIAVFFSFFFKEKIGQVFDIVFHSFSFLDSRMIGYLDMSREKIIHQGEYSFRLSTFIFRTIGISYLILNGRKFKSENGNYGTFLYNMVFVGFIIQEFIFGINIQRLNYYFYYLSFIVFALIVNSNLNEKTNRFMKTFSYIIIILYLLWFVNAVYSGAANCAPYKLSEEL